jgi:hypothetical protein
MKSVYLLFGPGENAKRVWSSIEQSKYSDSLGGEQVALLEDGDTLLVLINGEIDFPAKVPSLVADIRERLIQGPFTYGVLFQHGEKPIAGDGWTAVYFDKYGSVKLLGAVNRLINSSRYSQDFQQLVTHLQAKMKDGQYGSQK